MTPTVLMTKQYFLRLNIEQVQHIVDGILVRRDDITDDSLELYDNEMGEVLEQLTAQGLHIEIPEED